MKLGLAVVLLALLSGCASAQATHRHPGRDGTHVFVPRSRAEPVEVNGDEFKDALARRAVEVRPPARPQATARRLFQVEARSGSYVYEPGARHLTPLGTEVHLEGAPPTAERLLTRDYLRWCARTGEPGDCLRLLTERPIVDGDGRFTLALALAKGIVLDEMLEAFRDMADPHAMVAAVLWTWTTYMVLLALPDVTVSKGLAAVMTVTLVSYVGADTFWRLVVGFKRLMDEAERAVTFGELREAGARYGTVLGRDAARAFALLATVALGNTVPGLVAKVPALPGAMRAAAGAESQVGLRLADVAAVETVVVSAAAVTLTLSSQVVTMSAGDGPVTGTSTGVSDVRVDKVVNSNMPHAAERAVERAGFSSVQEAREALQAFGRRIEQTGLPSGAIRDTAHVDRVIVPGLGQGGAVVYQFRDGVLKLKTVLQWRP
ncbi:SitA5 family polymorphic toxin [Melittangium boletus]|uniref:SitA5 family polymorphic toxin n=1 Tax=Melittangium boletus TaxID=83453 RepID=UPI003DA69B79